MEYLLLILKYYALLIIKSYTEQIKFFDYNSSSACVPYAQLSELIVGKI